MRATTPELDRLHAEIKPWYDKTKAEARKKGINIMDITLPDPSWPDEIKEKHYLARKLSRKLREEFMS